MLIRLDVEAIDSAARDLLEEPGIRLDDPEIEKLVLSRGGREGGSAGVVRLPREMIGEHLALAPSVVRFAGQDGVISVGPDTPSRFWTGAALFYLDESGFRPIGVEDLGRFCRVIDGLDGVDAVVGTATTETPPACRDFVGLGIMARNTTKHLRALSFTPQGGEAMIEMARVLAGGRSLKDYPVFSVGFTAHGPLRWTSLALGVFRATAGHGIPCTVNGEPMAGASAPVTLAGTAAVGTAEILAGIVINQILEPRRPCLFNLGFAHAFDMKYGFAVTGGPENVLLAVAGAELARYYGLPSVSWMCSDSLDSDAQNALEKMYAAFAHAQARVSTVWGVGQVESEKTLSPVQAVVDDEIIRMVRRYEEGIGVTPETLAVDVSRQVGICGSFLAEEHTLDHFREELHETDLLPRVARESAAVGDSLIGRAEQRVREILAEDPRPRLDGAQERELERIESRFRRLLCDG